MRNQQRSRRKVIVTDRSSPLFDNDHYERSCKYKIKFETLPQASEAAEHASDRSGTRIEFYHCPYCKNYHLTSSLW